MTIYNTLSRKIEEIKPIGNPVKIYTCGLTVYSHPHIGNWVSYIYWDVLVATLKNTGHDVERVQNITDVGHLTSDEDSGEDKMLKGALKEGKTAWEVAEKYIKIADKEASQLKLSKPEHMPRATQYIAQQIDFVKKLEDKGFTYKLNDGIYFDTSKFKDYGKLAKLDIDGLKFGARVKDSGKKNPTDFALWKFSNPKEKRDMEWDSPWGIGFPGWHLECSVMAKELLGDHIDIHTGGIDHIPVHHTNEIAQTESITGKTFANYWIHANHLKVNGTKMSKSLGNIYTLEDINNKGFYLLAFKLLVLSKHYRTEGSFTWDNLQSYQNRLNNWLAAAALVWQPISKVKNNALKDIDTAIIKDITYNLQNDLDTPAVVFAIDKRLGHVLSKGITKSDVPALKQYLSAIDEMLGLDLSSQKDITKRTKEMLATRQKARETKNWEKADEIRSHLEDQGIEIDDTKNGQVWSRSK